MPAPTASRRASASSRCARSTARASVHTLSNADMGYTYRHSGAPDGPDLHARRCSRAMPRTRRRSRRRWTRCSIIARRCSRSARRPAARPSRTREGTSAWKVIDAGRLPRPDDRRRAGVADALQFPDQHRQRHRLRPRDISAKPCARGCWRIPASALHWEIKRIGRFKPGHEVDEFLGRLLSAPVNACSFSWLAKRLNSSERPGLPSSTTATTTIPTGALAPPRKVRRREHRRYDRTVVKIAIAESRSTH